MTGDSGRWLLAGRLAAVLLAWSAPTLAFAAAKPPAATALQAATADVARARAQQPKPVADTLIAALIRLAGAQMDAGRPGLDPAAASLREALGRLTLTPQTAQRDRALGQVRHMLELVDGARQRVAAEQAAAQAAREQRIATAQALSQAAYKADAESRHEDALAMRIEALATAGGDFPTNSAPHATLVWNVADSRKALRQWPQAEADLGAFLAAQRGSPAPAPNLLAGTLRRLADVADAQGQTAAALALRIQELPLRRAHAETLQAAPDASRAQRREAWFDVASTTGSIGTNGVEANAEADVLLALAAFERDPETDALLMSVYDIAIPIVRTNQPSLAEPIALRAMERAAMLKNPAAAFSWRMEFELQLADIALELGRPAQARTLLEAVAAASAGLPDPERGRRSAYRAITSLTVIKQRSGDIPGALRLASQALDLARGGQERYSSLVTMGSLQIRSNQSVEAAASLDQAVALDAQLWDPRYPYSYVSRQMLASELSRLGRHPQALVLNAAVVEAASRSHGGSWSQFRFLVGASSADIRRRAGQPAEAYGEVQSVARALLAGPGVSYGVSADSRNIFNDFRYVFRTQMRSGWEAAHGLPASRPRPDQPTTEQSS